MKQAFDVYHRSIQVGDLIAYAAASGRSTYLIKGLVKNISKSGSCSIVLLQKSYGDNKWSVSENSNAYAGYEEKRLLLNPKDYKSNKDFTQAYNKALQIAQKSGTTTKGKQLIVKALRDKLEAEFT